MNWKRAGAALALTAAVLLSVPGCSRQEPPDTERELLCQLHSGRRCLTNGDSFWEERDPAWDTCVLSMADQFSRPEEIRFTLTGEEERDAFAVDENRRVVWRRTLDGGEHRVTVTESMTEIFFPVQAGEAFQPVGTGMHSRMETPLAGRRLSVIGDSVSAYAGYIPWDDYSYYGSEDFGASSMWWAVLAERTGMELCRINAVSSSGVTVTPKDVPSDRQTAGNSDRCKDLSSRSGEAPDEILMLIGVNDYLRGVSAGDIERAYLEMIVRVQNAYPDAALHVCTYYQCPTLPAERLEELNGLLRDVAERSGVGLIDLENCGIIGDEPRTYLTDEELHPNERGEILMGLCAAGKLLEGEAAA